MKLIQFDLEIDFLLCFLLRSVHRTVSQAENEKTSVINHFSHQLLLSFCFHLSSHVYDLRGPPISR